MMKSAHVYIEKSMAVWAHYWEMFWDFYSTVFFSRETKGNLLEFALHLVSSSDGRNNCDLIFLLIETKMSVWRTNKCIIKNMFNLQRTIKTIRMCSNDSLNWLSVHFLCLLVNVNTKTLKWLDDFCQISLGMFDFLWVETNMSVWRTYKFIIKNMSSMLEISIWTEHWFILFAHLWMWTPKHPNDVLMF